MGVNDQLHISAAVHLRKGSTVPKNKWLSRLHSWPGFDDEGNICFSGLKSISSFQSRIDPIQPNAQLKTGRAHE
jgi:hypothetical protein